jgi:hypothetical protein
LASRVTEPVSAPWDDRWKSSFAAPNTPAKIRELSALIEELAKTDPTRAISLAASVTDWRIRDILRDAALRGWASVSPADAGNFVLTLRPEDRRAAAAATLEGAVNKPQEAVELALRLCKADPAPAGDYGHAAIAALVDAGEFQQAARFGELVGTEKYPFLLQSAFFQWSRSQPDRALAATDAIADPILRSKAYGEVISGWAWADPKGLAQHALQMPGGPGRSQAFAEALPLWIEKDPDGAIAWINSNDSGPEFDSGVAAMANMQSFIVHQPGTAMGLASDINDRKMRRDTMRSVFRQWALNDISAARRYLESGANATDRATLQSEIEDLVP